MGMHTFYATVLKLNEIAHLRKYLDIFGWKSKVDFGKLINGYRHLFVGW